VSIVQGRCDFLTRIDWGGVRYLWCESPWLLKRRVFWGVGVK
jgi:hypothetical protein